ncbi:hypothetical protein pb186bvf_019277 [Paramecium bursaria]
METQSQVYTFKGQLMKLEREIKILAWSQQIQEDQAIANHYPPDDIYFFIKENYPQSQIIPIGWSLGGCVIMKLASDYSHEFNHLILIASAGAHGHHLLVDSKQQSIKQLTRSQIQEVPKITKNLEMLQQRNYEFFYKLFKNALFNSGRHPSKLDFLEYITESLKQTNYLDVAVVLNELDISDQVNKIKGPVLLYHGELDRIVPLSDVYKNIQNIGKEKCKLIIEKDVSHMPPLEVPDILAQEILNFIR